MAKITRERALIEKRARKQEKKEERKAAALAAADTAIGEEPATPEDASNPEQAEIAPGDAADSDSSHGPV